MKSNKDIKFVKMQIQSGNATPSSSIGPMLGQHGINIVKFCKEFNEKTKQNTGMVNSVIITIYPDKSYSFIIKNPPTTIFIKKILGLKLSKKPGAGSKTPGKINIGKINRSQLLDIAKEKKNDLNAYTLDKCIKIISGTAKSMGIEIE